MSHLRTVPSGLCGTAITLALVARPAAAEEADATAETAVVAEGSRPVPHRIAAEPGSSTSVVSEARLARPGSSLGDALRETPGIQVSELGGLGGGTTARLRGATAAQTPVYFGGVRLNDEVGGVADLGQIPKFLLERVEIYRSHAPRSVSQWGVGGAIVLVPKEVKSTGGTLEGSVGSYGLWSTSGAGTYRNETQSVLVAASLDHADNNYAFNNTKGTLFDKTDDQTELLSNADTSGKSFLLRGEQLFGRASLEVLLSHVDREQGAPRLALVPTYESRAESVRSLYGVTARVPSSVGQLIVQTSGVFAGTILHDPARELGLISERVETEGQRLEQLAELRHELTTRLAVFEQATFSLETLKRYDGAGSHPDPTLSAKRVSLRGALGAELEIVDDVFASANLEGRCFDTGPTDLAPCASFAPGARAGLRTTLGNAEVFLSVARYTRPPTLSELYGTALLVRGNPLLVPEEGLTLELGTRYPLALAGGRSVFWLDAGAFARFSDRLITFVRTAQGYLAPVNRLSARTLGSELALGLAPLKELTFGGQVSLLDPRDTSENRLTENDILPFLSRATASLFATYEFKFESAAFSRLEFGVRGLYQSSRYGDPAGLGVIPEQSSVDLETAMRCFSDSLRVRGRIANLLDSARYDVVGFPLPGRSAFVSAELQLP